MRCSGRDVNPEASEGPEAWLRTFGGLSEAARGQAEMGMLPTTAGRYIFGNRAPQEPCVYNLFSFRGFDVNCTIDVTCTYKHT